MVYFFEDMTGTLAHNGFTLSDITLKDEVIPNTDSFELLIGDANDYCTPELESVTIQDRLNEISILSEIDVDIDVDDDDMTPISISSGIEATDVCSLFEAFLEYEQASDVEPLSYPESSVMSPNDSPGEKDSEGDVLDTLKSVQEKLSKEVGDDEVTETTIIETVVDDILVMNVPIEDKLTRTVNGIHPKGNLCRMADSPKFAKFKKKRLTNDPPLRIASSLPNTPRCTSPSDSVSVEERKHMEIKLIEALALPMPAKTPLKGKDSKNTKDIKINKISKESQKKLLCPTKRKQPPVEPIPSRLMPVVSKRQRNNIEKNKVKDPRLKENFDACLDPRLSKPDYCTKLNITQLKTTNLTELNSATNTATETVDDVGILDMLIDPENDSYEIPNETIDHDKLKETVLLGNVTIDHERINEPLVNSSTTTIDHLGMCKPPLPGNIVIKQEPIDCEPIIVDLSKVKQEEISIPVCDPLNISVADNFVLPYIKQEVISPVPNSISEVEVSTALEIVEFPSISAIEIKTEEVVIEEVIEEVICSSDTIKIKNEVIAIGLIKPEKNYRKTPSVVNGNYSSASDHECDDDDRAYNRKKLSKKSNSKKLSKPIKRSLSSNRFDNSRSRSSSKTPSVVSRSASRRRSRSPSRQRSRSRRKRRSISPGGRPNTRGDMQSSESSSDRSDRSDGENIDISNKLIELSNPVPYDIEHERKLRFLSGGAAKGMGERRNIYAGGITENTTKAELAERFRRFGKISKITLHFRDKGDNYAFIVFEDPDNAMRAIEEGNDDPNYSHLDLCFGGRRKFVGGSYVDFDGNNRFLEETDKKSINNRCEPEEDDFDRLLKLAMNDRKKREVTPEWS